MDIGAVRFEVDDVGRAGVGGSAKVPVVKETFSLKDVECAIRYFICDYNLTRSAALPG